MKAFALALLLMAGGNPDAPPAALTAQVQRDIKDDMPPVRPARRLFKAVDVSHDEIADWHVDYEPQGMAWCGTGGCTQKLFVSRSDGSYVTAFDEQTREFRLSQSPLGVLLDIEIHGSNCELSGVEECRRRFLWSDTLARFVEQPNAAGESRLTGPLFQPTPAPDYPPAVMAVLAELDAACAAEGAVYEGGGSNVALAPDLTGDGQPDWIVGSPYASCVLKGSEAEARAPFSPGLRIVSGEAVILQLTGDIYLVDVAQRPARFISVASDEKCGGLSQPACPETAYRWDAASGRLVPDV